MLLPAVGCASAGKPAAFTPEPKKALYPWTALIVVDVQRGIFPLHREATFLAAVRTLVDRANEAGVPVIYVYHTDAGSFTPGKETWLLHPSLTPPEGAEQVRKSAADSFSGTELEVLLDARRVGRVVICGLGSTACVSATLWGAHGRGYDLVLPSDAHSMPLTGSSLEALERFNEFWKGNGAEVLPAAEVDFKKTAGS
jgi:nicotinamidase-related amidase